MDKASYLEAKHELDTEDLNTLMGALEYGDDNADDNSDNADSSNDNASEYKDNNDSNDNCGDNDDDDNNNDLLPTGKNT